MVNNVFHPGPGMATLLLDNKPKQKSGDVFFVRVTGPNKMFAYSIKHRQEVTKFHDIVAYIFTVVPGIYKALEQHDKEYDLYHIFEIDNNLHMIMNGSYKSHGDKKPDFTSKVTNVLPRLIRGLVI